MRRFVVALLLTLILALPGCGIKQSTDSGDTAVSTKLAYCSDTSTEDCYLCGGGIESLIPECWGQNNVALISLNTFEIKPIEINRYDVNGQLIEESIGAISFGGSGIKDGGFSANIMLEFDRGYASGSLNFHDDERLDIDKAASFLCADCLNEILPQRIDRCFGVGAIHLATKEIRIFDESGTGFGLDDFYFNCNLEEQDDGSHWMDLLIFFCPIRFENKS